MCSFEISLPHALMKIGTFLLEAIQRATSQRNALPSHIKWQIKEQGEVGLDVLMHTMLQRQKLGPIQTASTALVGISGIAETVTDYPFTPRQGGLD